MASARGWQLRRWRYGPETDRLVQDAIERDRWAIERWRDWREERLTRVLERAATRVPFYRAAWEARRRRGDRASWAYLENWPVLEKEALRQSARAFVADDCDPARMIHEHTSGTTGTSLDLWWSRETTRAWYALNEARCRRWYGVAQGDRWAIVGGQLVVPVARRDPPFWVWNAPLRQLYLSAYHLAPDLIPHYLDALKAHRVRYVLGYPSALHALAAGAIAAGRDDLRLEVAITNAEPVYPHQRVAIERAFGGKVRETYGMAEIVAAASECEHGSLHAWPEVGFTEVLPSTARDSDGQRGELLCTSLLNADMPLIRYRLGDRADLRSPDTACACGRSLPIVGGIEGRADDLLYTTDGRAIGRLDPVFKDALPVVEAQIIQESLGSVRVRFVPAAGFGRQDESSLVERLRDRLGNVTVHLERVPFIPRAHNGKFRAVVCEVPVEQRPTSSAVS